MKSKTFICVIISVLSTLSLYSESADFAIRYEADRRNIISKCDTVSIEQHDIERLKHIIDYHAPFCNWESDTIVINICFADNYYYKVMKPSMDSIYVSSAYWDRCGLKRYDLKGYGSLKEYFGDDPFGRDDVAFYKALKNWEIDSIQALMANTDTSIDASSIVVQLIVSNNKIVKVTSISYYPYLKIPESLLKAWNKKKSR